MNDTIRPFVDDAVARIADRYRGLPETAADRLTPPIAHAYHQGRHDALSQLMPVDAVASLLGVTRSYVHRLAREADIGWTIGRERLFTPTDVEAMRNRPDGRRRT